jgi:peptidyl-prolyl cis-trans isomerase C
LDKRNEMDVPYEKARKGIRSMLFWERKNKLIQKYYEEAKVNLHPSEEHLLAKVGEEGINEEVIAPVMKIAKESEKDTVRDKWIHYLVETNIFSRKAREEHLENDPEATAEIVRLKNQTLANAFRKRFINDKIKVSDQDIEKFYQSHLEEFRIPAKVRIKSIVVKTQQEAESLLKELKEGSSFSDLAMKKSIHPSAARGGEVGWFARGEKDPTLEKAAFSLEKGGMSGVIKIDTGCEIIKLIDKKGGEIRPLDEVKQNIKMKLMTQQLEETKQRYYQKNNSMTPKIQG